MPVVAESPPIIFGAPAGSPTPTPEPTGTPTPTPTSEPTQTPTPTPTSTPEPGTRGDLGNFIIKHQQFVDRVAGMSCFKREDLPDYTTTEFEDHIEVAKQDKFIVQTKDMYCSMSGARDLVRNLKRVSEEQEIIT